MDDPPGDPVVGIKLVNDLDLVVTNLDTGDVFLGNDIIAGDDFNLPWNTNSAPNVDIVNNVENVYLLNPLGTNYSVTVVGKRVNVNAVTQNTNEVVQDYALVISSDATFTNGLAFTNSVNGTNVLTSTGPSALVTTPWVVAMTNMFQGASNITGGMLLYQRVGASTPLLGTNTIPVTNTDPIMGATGGQITVGMTNQWHFYIMTNENATYTNAAFLTFLPSTLSIPRMGVRADTDENSTRPEGDVDLYVSTNSALTNLDPVALTNAIKSLGRGVQRRWC